MDRHQAEIEVRRIERRCMGPLDESDRALVTELLNRGKLRKAAELNVALRKGCGADINDLICQFPFDGAEHLEPCPGCGRLVLFYSPDYGERPEPAMEPVTELELPEPTRWYKRLWQRLVSNV